MKKISKRKITRIISYIITFVLLVGMIGGAAYMAKIMLGSYDSFSVGYKDEVYFEDIVNKVFPFNSELTFNVDYDYNKLVVDKQYGYTVKVVPAVSAETDFAFDIGDHSYMFSDEQDITSAFNVVLSDNSFSLVIPGNISDVLEVIYGGSDIKVPELDNDKDYYKLIVTAFDGTEICISFKQYSAVTGVVINTESIIFIGDGDQFIIGDSTSFIPKVDSNTGDNTGGGFGGGVGGAR